jgi:Uncharacterized protein conserved in bacteria
MEDPEDIAYWQRIDARITTSGRLEPGDPARLAALGVRHVINLALTDSPGALPGEEALMANAGLAYVHLPVPFGAPDAEHFEAFAREMNAAGSAAVHIHCVRNWRVSAFLYRWNRLQGMDAARAASLLYRQWDPATSDHPDAPAWRRFLAGE